MFSSAFRQFEGDPFFDFGNSPFGRYGGAFFRDDPTDYRHPARNAELPPPRGGSDYPAAAGADAAQPASDSRALVPSLRHRQQQPGVDRRVDRYNRRADDSLMPRDDLLMAGFPQMLGSFAAMDRHFNHVFEGMHRMMAGMSDRMRHMEEAASREDFDGHVYSHASVYTQQSDPAGGEPHVYQAMSETRAAPGGVRETRRAMRDSRSREERAAHGRHIGNRGHVVERRRNGGTGEQEESHNYNGIEDGEARGDCTITDAAEADAFDKEWHSRATAFASGRLQQPQQQLPGGKSAGRHRAIEAGASSKL